MKQRLVGAVVLIALAVIFVPMLVQGPAPDSGVSDVPLDVPAGPAAPNVREIPLGVPARTGASATGMPAPQVAPADAPAPATGGLFPAVAAGDYAVSFGSYATPADADKVIEALRTAELPAWREAHAANGRQLQRVRIGPFADRAVAEAARLRSAHVRDDLDAAVITLDASSDSAATASAAPPAPQPVAAPPVPAAKPDPAPAPKPVAAAPKPAPIAKPEPPKPAPQPAAPAPKPVATAASGIGYAVQVGAFSGANEATAMRDKLRAAGFNAFTEAVRTDKGTLTRVRVGPVAGRAEADALRAQVAAKAGVSGIVRPHP